MAAAGAGQLPKHEHRVGSQERQWPAEGSAQTRATSRGLHLPGLLRLEMGGGVLPQDHSPSEEPNAGQDEDSPAHGPYHVPSSQQQQPGPPVLWWVLLLGPPLLLAAVLAVEVGRRAVAEKRAAQLSVAAEDVWRELMEERVMRERLQERISWLESELGTETVKRKAQEEKIAQDLEEEKARLRKEAKETAELRAKVDDLWLELKEERVSKDTQQVKISWLESELGTEIVNRNVQEEICSRHAKKRRLFWKS